MTAFNALKKSWLDSVSQMEITVRHGLLYIGDHLAIPRVPAIREDLFHLTHDALRHFGIDKFYATLYAAYYWLHVQKELKDIYIPACKDCQQNKAPIKRLSSSLRPLLVSDGCCESVAIDFIGSLPLDNGYNCIVTLTCCLNSDIHLIPAHTDLSAESFAKLFFYEWYCDNGLSLDIVSDCDKLFISHF